jgi:hypothetical protein
MSLEWLKFYSGAQLWFGLGAATEHDHVSRTRQFSGSRSRWFPESEIDTVLGLLTASCFDYSSLFSRAAVPVGLVILFSSVPFVEEQVRSRELTNL